LSIVYPVLRFIATQGKKTNEGKNTNKFTEGPHFLVLIIILL